jgi:hypothetical protein
LPFPEKHKTPPARYRLAPPREKDRLSADVPRSATARSEESFNYLNEVDIQVSAPRRPRAALPVFGNQAADDLPSFGLGNHISIRMIIKSIARTDFPR